MIDLAILGLLKDEELHGYELKKRLGELLGPLSRVSFGSLYPALARLERSGAVRAVEATDATSRPLIPMTGSLGGEVAAFRAARRAVEIARGTRGTRGKKVYGLTDVGARRLVELVAEPGDDDRSFALKVAVCRHLRPADRLALFQRRRAELADRLAAAEATLADGGERLDAYTRSLVEHDTESTRHDIAWLDGLIAAAADEAGTPTTGGPHP